MGLLPYARTDPLGKKLPRFSLYLSGLACAGLERLFACQPHFGANNQAVNSRPLYR